MVFFGYLTSMGVSENSVPLNPMVLLIIIPIKWLFVWEYTLFSDKPKTIIVIKWLLNGYFIGPYIRFYFIGNIHNIPYRQCQVSRHSVDASPMKHVPQLKVFEALPAISAAAAAAAFDAAGRFNG